MPPCQQDTVNDTQNGQIDSYLEIYVDRFIDIYKIYIKTFSQTVKYHKFEHCTNTQYTIPNSTHDWALDLNLIELN